MKKGLLFLSAAITIFILVFLASAIIKVRASVLDSATSTLVPTDTATQMDIATQVDIPTIQPTDTVIPSPTISPYISPQEAVFIASALLGDTKVYSVDTVTRYGMDTYQVNFSSGNIVFVSPQGHILMVTSNHSYVAAPTTVPPSNSNTSSAPHSSTAKHNHNDDNGGDN